MYARLSKLFNLSILRRPFSRRGLLIFTGALVCVYALVVLFYVQSVPHLGLKTIFSTEIKATPVVRNPAAGEPQPGDKVERIADQAVGTWPDLLNAPFRLREKLADNPAATFPWLKREQIEDSERVWIEVEFSRAGKTFSAELLLGELPVEELIPSILWFFLKMMLFMVGALVLWKRPADSAAAQFFLLCIVTLGAYMGGYHWNHIAVQPVLILVFMVCAVMLPVVSLHFYQIFPRRKPWLERRPRLTFFALYAVPLGFLALLVVLYFRLRGFVRGGADAALIAETLGLIRVAAYGSLVVAAVWYLLCVLSLIHSRWIAQTDLERNQVNWILRGAFIALFPIGYSFYLAVWDPNAFGAGAATWPMFLASLCLTAAFAVSITRYRLMEFDQIIGSGLGYFFISFLAALVYYAVVLVGTRLVPIFEGPSLPQALTVSTTALVLMLMLDMARTRLRKALDRRFHRDKSQLDRTLQQMRQAIGQLVDPPALAHRLLQASTELLGAARGAIYLRQGEPALYRLVGSVGEPPQLTELPPGCPLIETLNDAGVVSVRPRLGLPLTPAQRQLHFLGGELAHALAHEGRLLALLVLGPKDSPYRGEDVDLLAAFAQITVLALESAEGHRTIEQLNVELQGKVEKISEQQRRILALQSQLRRQTLEDGSIKGDGAPAEASPDGQPTPSPAPGGIVGSSPVVQQLLHLVRKVAGTDAVVLVRGESGTGKELLARAVHETSSRAAKAFVKVHCAALSANLLESELFGHVKGAFTGAHRDKVGRFELANGGTLFLDEIGDVTLEVQTKLLRVLQEKTFERVGSSEPITVDVRIIAATHQDLEALIRQGRFREDLFYRLNVFPIVVPPLRERPEDIAELAMHFIRQSAARCRKEVVQIDDDALALLKSCTWPGNIRHLENVIERAVVISEGPMITPHELPHDVLRTAEPMPAQPNGNGAPQAAPAGEPRVFSSHRAERERLEREQLVRALAAAAGNKAEAARALGMARSTLVSRLKKLGLS